MPDFYELLGPTAPPALPVCWSWSSLQAWRRCPRQWWLLRAHYPNAITPYPQPTYAATVEGLLLHHVVESFVDHAGRAVAGGLTSAHEIRSSFPARKVLQEKLRAIIREDTNPRFDVGRVLARVSVDDCLNAFRAVAPSCLERALSMSSGRRSPRADGRELRTGAEVSIQVADPPLCGRLDYVTPNGITDFKTGEEDAAHQEQLRFYALLAWLLTGRVPESLTIFYVREDRQVSVPVPTPSELSDMARSYQSEIAEISEQIKNGLPRANPNESNCCMCPVRQLCDPYWVAMETASLRLTTKSVSTRASVGRGWMDVELSALPPVNQLGGYTGTGHARELGEVRISIGPSQAAGSVSVAVSGARLLNAAVEFRDNQCFVSVARSGEVFWMDKSELGFPD
jgi:hypothetical protein